MPLSWVGQPAVTAVDVCILRPGGGLAAVDPKWLKGAVNSSQFRRAIELRSSGTTRKRISRKNLESLDLGVPPLNEQRRIVAKIEELTARSRRAREALEAVPPLLEKLRQSVLAAAFSGRLTADRRAAHPDVEPAPILLGRIRAERRRRWEESELAKLRAKGKEPKDDRWKQKYKEPKPVDPTGLPELPEGWCWASLETLAWDSQYGISAKCDYEANGVAVLRIPNVASGRVDPQDLKFSRIDLGLEDDQLLSPGDFLIVRTNGSRDLVGRAAVVTSDPASPTYFASYLIRYRLLQMGWMASWLGYIWQSPNVRKRLLDLAATSAGQYNISLTKLSAVAVPLPPELEMSDLVRVIESSLCAPNAIAPMVRAEEMHLSDLSQTILAKAFRGELVAQDPTDEPASVLLERIRAQRAEEEATGGKGRARRGTRRASHRDGPGPRPPQEPRTTAGRVARGPAPARFERFAPPESRAAEPQRLPYDEPARAATTGPNPIPYVLDWLRTHPGPHAPAQILAATGFDRDLWPLIRPALAEDPNITVTGRKRGTKYEWKERA